MTRVSIDEAQRDLPDLIARVEAGEPVFITRDGKAVVSLKHCKRQFGSLKGKIKIDDSFFDPLPEEELRLWEGWGD